MNARRLTILATLWLLLTASAAVLAIPRFGGKDINGKAHYLSDYKGKMVVVNFWATWCPPCREELPELSMFHDNHKDKDAVVLGVNFEDIGKPALKAFLDDQMIDYPVLTMFPAQGTALGRIVALPTSYIVSPDQSSIKVHVGPLTSEDLTRYLESFKKQASSGRR